MTAAIGKRSLALCMKQILPLVRPCRNISLTSNNRSKIYELRTYIVKPANFREYLDLTKEKLHLRTAHSKLNGFWVSELGGINEVSHLWEYDSLAHRTEVRQKLAMDQTWLKTYINLMLPFIDKQENALVMESPLKRTEDSPLQEGGVYELCRYEIKMGWEHSVMQLIMTRARLMEETGEAKLMGMFSTDVGPSNSVYHLWNFKSMDKRQEVNMLVNNATKGNTKEIYDHVTSMSNKLMIPTPYSPLK